MQFFTKIKMLRSVVWHFYFLVILWSNNSKNFFYLFKARKALTKHLTSQRGKNEERKNKINLTGILGNWRLW
ncbi:unnamed protein product [Meloidogyne enterolobii]|uniref:Uncharacterized protein n=1 Tax=Meloidogyne enterolobii TaxID=390850 RepID=A0ACB0ZUZ0_MELEN